MLNAMTCDRCGHTEQLPMIVWDEEVGTDGGKQMVEALFYNAKRMLAELGWYTSTGYDLCPTCCKVEGKRPGYVESGLAPDTIFIKSRLHEDDLAGHITEGEWERLNLPITEFEEQALVDALTTEVGDRCFCGNAFAPETTLCSECIALLGKREFAIGQKVVIIRNETWKGRICTITLHAVQNPNMYWLKEHGWRRCDEIEAV